MAILDEKRLKNLRIERDKLNEIIDLTKNQSEEIYLIKDKEKILTLVARNGAYLKVVSEKFQNDREVVFTAVNNYSRSLQHASNILKNDKEIVLMAVTQDGINLEFANKAFKNDKEMALIAFTNNDNAYKHFSEILKEEIGQSDPIQYLKSAILKEKLEREIPNKNNSDKTKTKL